MPATPEKVARALDGSDVRAGAERGLGAGAAAFLQKVTRELGSCGAGSRSTCCPPRASSRRTPACPWASTGTTCVARSSDRRPVPEAGLGRGGEPGGERDPVGPQHLMVGHLQDKCPGQPVFRPPAIISSADRLPLLARAARPPTCRTLPAGMGAPNESVPIHEILHW